MSLFGSLMGDLEDDPYFGSHMRHMRHMNNMMNSLFADPFDMFGGGGPLAIGGPRQNTSMMPFMPPMPNLNKLMSGDMFGMGGPIAAGSSFSSSTVVMSNGPNGKPQVISSTSSTKIGPNGVKETKKTLQDSRTGVKKMAIGHHIGDRAHMVEREQNLYSGDAEERQEFVNLDEEEADEFDREFQRRAGIYTGGGHRAIHPSHSAPQRLALPPAPSTATSNPGSAGSSRRIDKPSARRPIRNTPGTLNSCLNVRQMYGTSHPQRNRHKTSKPHRHSPTEN